MRKLFRFLWGLVKLCVVLALGLNSLTFIILTYRKADDAFVEECSRTVTVRFRTTLHVQDGRSGVGESGGEDAAPASREIPAGTEVKVLAVYAEGLNGRVKPHWYNVHQDWYIELDDGSRGHAVLPEACIGTVCEDPDGNRMVIRDIRRRNAENGEVRYVWYMEGSSRAWEAEELYFPVQRTSRAYAYPVYTDNPGIRGLSLSLGRGFYSYPFIMDLFVLPYWLRLVLGVLGVVFLIFYIPFKYFLWLSDVSLRPLYDDSLSADKAEKKARRRHAVGWWAFFILSGSVLCPPLWLVYWMTAGWKEELAGMMRLRCPRCRKMGVQVHRHGFRRELVRTYVDDFQESKSFDKGYWHSKDVTDRDREYLSKTHDRQSLTFRGRRRMREYMSVWVDRFECPFCGYTAEKKGSSRDTEQGEVLSQTVTRTVVR